VLKFAWELFGPWILFKELIALMEGFAGMAL